MGMRNGWMLAPLLLLTACGGGSDDSDDDKYGAEVVCEDFVKDRLKSPKSAEFEWTEHEEIKDKVWKVTGTVDSENSFGASIRNEVVCTVRNTDGDNWRLKNLTGLEN